MIKLQQYKFSVEFESNLNILGDMIPGHSY